MSATEAAVPYRPSLLLLVLIIGTSLLAIAIYIPSMPSIADSFDTSMGQVQLTLTLYLIGFAISQLIYGPLSDRYGRRPAMLSALIVFFVSSVACTFAPSIEFLIGARIVQAFGACAGVVLTRAIVRDVYDRTESARAMAYLGHGHGLGAGFVAGAWRATAYPVRLACQLHFHGNCLCGRFCRDLGTLA